MSNGDPPPQSSAPYIIICSGRIAVQTAKSTEEKIKAASDCAAQLVSHIELAIGSQIEREHSEPISILQHEMMDGMATMSKGEAEIKIAQMFVLLDALEDEYKNGQPHEY